MSKTSATVWAVLAVLAVIGVVGMILGVDGPIDWLSKDRILAEAIFDGLALVAAAIVFHGNLRA